MFKNCRHAELSVCRRPNKVQYEDSRGKVPTPHSPMENDQIWLYLFFKEKAKLSTLIRDQRELSSSSSKDTQLFFCQPRPTCYTTSLMNPRVPKLDASSSNTLSLSVFCTSINLSSCSLTSELTARTSPCILRNTFWKACTASKSRCERRRCTSAVRKRCCMSSVTNERISRSMAAGESVLT